MTLVESLPDDIDGLKAIIMASQVQITEQDAVITRKQERITLLEKLVVDFKRALFGSKSEKFASAQYQLALDDIEPDIIAIQTHDDGTDVPRNAARKNVT